MKSIKDWMYERGMISEDFDKMAAARYFGSTQVDVDQDIRRELKNKVQSIVDRKKSLSKDEILKRLRVAISQIVSGMGGSKLSSGGLAGRLSDDDNKVNRSRFANMMGSENLEVDTQIRRWLEPKIEFIKSMEDPKTKKPYGELSKSELEDKLIAAVSQLVGEMSGGKLSLSRLEKQINSQEEEPVARESASLPSFVRWVENNEEQEGAVSEPQHEEGEVDMDLKAVVEKRMMQMAMELESDGKGSRQEVLAAMKAVVDSAGKEDEDQQGNDQQGGDQPPQEPNQRGGPPPQQGPQGGGSPPQQGPQG